MENWRIGEFDFWCHEQGTSFFFPTLHWIPTFNDGGCVPGKPQLFKKQFNFFYNTRAILTCSWFETTLDYKISVRTKLPFKHQINMGGFRIPQEVSTLNGELKFIPETLLFMSVIFYFSLLNLNFWHFALVYLRFWMSTALVKINTNHFWPLKMSKIRFMTFKTRFNWIYNWNYKTNIFCKAVYWFQNWKSQKIALWHFELSVVISKKKNWRHLVCFTELVITTQSNTQ